MRRRQPRLMGYKRRPRLDELELEPALPVPPRKRPWKYLVALWLGTSLAALALHTDVVSVRPWLEHVTAEEAPSRRAAANLGAGRATDRARVPALTAHAAASAPARVYEPRPASDQHRIVEQGDRQPAPNDAMLVDPHAAERRRNDAPQPGVEAQPRDPPGDDPGIIVAGYAGPAQPFAGEAPSPAEPRSDVDDSDVDADDASYDELDVP